MAEPYNSESYRELKVSHDQEWSEIPGLGINHVLHSTSLHENTQCENWWLRDYNSSTWEVWTWQRVFLQNRANTISLPLHLLPEHRDRGPGTFLDNITVFWVKMWQIKTGSPRSLFPSQTELCLQQLVCVCVFVCIHCSSIYFCTFRSKKAFQAITQLIIQNAI